MVLAHHERESQFTDGHARVAADYVDVLNEMGRYEESARRARALLDRARSHEDSFPERIERFERALATALEGLEGRAREQERQELEGTVGAAD